MTKREPFAQFEDYHEGYELSGMLLGGVCFIELPMGAPGDIEIVDKTNDAHEARVKEAVKKAVEEFRKKVVAACRDPWRVCQLAICDQGSQYGRGWYEGQWYMQKACSNAVADIPAEPEEAKP